MGRRAIVIAGEQVAAGAIGDDRGGEAIGYRHDALLAALAVDAQVLHAVTLLYVFDPQLRLDYRSCLAHRILSSCSEVGRP